MHKMLLFLPEVCFLQAEQLIILKNQGFLPYHKALPDIHSSSASLYTGCWHGLSTKAGACFPGYYPDNNSLAYQWAGPCPDLFVFLIQSHPVIFRMSHNKDLPAFLGHGQEHPCFLRFCQNRQFLAVVDIFCRHFCMAGMRCQKYIIKSLPGGSSGS